MEKILPIYALIFTLLLAVTVYTAMRSDGSVSQKLSRVRIRVDEKRSRRMTDPPEEEFEPVRAVELLVLGSILLLICMLLSKV